MGRYHDDGWFFEGTVRQSLEHDRYLVQDEDDTLEVVQNEDICLRVPAQSLERGTTVCASIALHSSLTTLASLRASKVPAKLCTCNR